MKKFIIPITILHSIFFSPELICDQPSKPEFMDETDCKFMVSNDFRWWIEVNGHLYEIKQVVHSIHCDCEKYD